MKITPAFESSFLKVVATETESNTASTGDARSGAMPSSTSTSRSGMPSFS